jgi:hypothetical protein
MGGFKFGSVLKMNGALIGGRSAKRWFALPGRRHASERRFGCGPAVFCGHIRDWEAGPRDFGGVRGTGASGTFLS